MVWSTSKLLFPFKVGVTWTDDGSAVAELIWGSSHGKCDSSTDSAVDVGGTKVSNLIRMNK